MDKDDNLISDSAKISNIFNDHFSTLGANVQAKIPNVHGSYRNYLNKKNQTTKQLHINPLGCSFFLSATGPDEIAKIINGLDTNKSTGPFGLPVCGMA